jgi:hypothetical protein
MQVLLDEVEFRTIERLAQRDGLTTSEWARRRLREAATGEPRDTASKLAAIRSAYLHQAPAPDIELMLDEIGRGYASSPDASRGSTA